MHNKQAVPERPIPHKLSMYPQGVGWVPAQEFTAYADALEAQLSAKDEEHARLISEMIAERQDWFFTRDHAAALAHKVRLALSTPASGELSTVAPGPTPAASNNSAS